MGKPWEIVVGEVRRILRDMPDCSFDACLSDPPYGLRFMGNRWDYTIPSANTWVELLRVLKPGAYSMLFGGTKTFHRLMVAVEDAGFLPLDTCMWMHGKGFPKSLDVSKAIDKRLGVKRTKVVGHKNAGLDRGSGASVDFQGSKGRDETGLIPITEAATPQAARWEGYGTALKPAWEPVMLACKMQDGTYAENALRHGTGALAIDASRIGATGGTAGRDYEKTGLFGMGGKAIIEELQKGRWPANIVLSHDDECVLRGTKQVRGTVPTARPPGGRTDSVARGHMAGGLADSRAAGIEEVEDWECVEDCPVRMLDEQAGDCPGMSGGGVHRPGYAGGMFGAVDAGHLARGDRGGPSRFYYVTKASRAERDRGLEETAVAEGVGVGALRDGGRGPRTVRDAGGAQHTAGVVMAKNDHPTVKPIDLCRYFARLLLPPPREDGEPRRIIVPFSGSGSEMIGCLQAGWDEVVGIELNPKHAEKARLRISKGKILQNSGGKKKAGLR